MPRPRFAKLDEATRRRILETAAEAFAGGYETASLNHVIERLGMSKGSFYYYFDDKADLLGAVLEMAWRQFLPERPFDIGALDAETFWPTLRAWVREAHEIGRSKPWLIGVSRLFYHPPSDPRVAAIVADKFSEALAMQAAFMHRGQEIGVVRDDLPSELLMSMLTAADTAADRWMLDNWDRFSPEELERIAERWLGLLETMLRPVDHAGEDDE